MFSKFPVGEERHAVGQVTPQEPVNIKITYDNITDVKGLRVKFWGKDNQCISRDIDVADSVTVALVNDAIEIGATLYTLHAIFSSDEERLISKGRVWLSDTN